MCLPHFFVGLNHAKFAPPQLGANVANRFSSRRVVVKSHKQTIRKFIAVSIPINVGNNDLDRSRFVEPFQEFSRIALAFEMTKQMSGLFRTFFLQPT